MCDSEPTLGMVLFTSDTEQVRRSVVWCWNVDINGGVGSLLHFGLFGLNSAESESGLRLWTLLIVNWIKPLLSLLDVGSYISSLGSSALDMLLCCFVTVATVWLKQSAPMKLGREIKKTAIKAVSTSEDGLCCCRVPRRSRPALPVGQDGDPLQSDPQSVHFYMKLAIRAMKTCRSEGRIIILHFIHPAATSCRKVKPTTQTSVQEICPNSGKLIHHQTVGFQTALFSSRFTLIVWNQILRFKCSRNQIKGFYQGQFIQNTEGKHFLTFSWCFWFYVTCNKYTNIS